MLTFIFTNKNKISDCKALLERLESLALIDTGSSLIIFGSWFDLAWVYSFVIRFAIKFIGAV